MNYRLEGRNLRLIATPAERRRFERWKLSKRIGQPWVRFEVFSHFTKFDWAWINPSTTGDLTSAPMIAAIAPPRLESTFPSNENRRNTHTIFAGYKYCRGVLDYFCHPIIRRWAYMDYQIKNPEDDLVEYGECVFQGTEDGPVDLCPPPPATQIKKIRGRVFKPSADQNRWIMVMDNGGTKDERMALLAALNRGQSVVVNTFGDAHVELNEYPLDGIRDIAVCVRHKAAEAGFAFDVIEILSQNNVIKLDFYVFDDSDVLTYPLDSNTARNWPTVLELPRETHDEYSLYYAISRARAALAGKGPAIRIATTALLDEQRESKLTFHRDRMFGVQSITWGTASDLATEAGVDWNSSFQRHLPVQNWQESGSGFTVYGTSLRVNLKTKNIGMALQFLNDVETRLETGNQINERTYEGYLRRIRHESERKRQLEEFVVFKPSVNLNRSLMLD